MPSRFDFLAAAFLAAAGVVAAFVALRIGLALAAAAGGRFLFALLVRRTVSVATCRPGFVFGCESGEPWFCSGSFAGAGFAFAGSLLSAGGFGVFGLLALVGGLFGFFWVVAGVGFGAGACRRCRCLVRIGWIRSEVDCSWLTLVLPDCPSAEADSPSELCCGVCDCYPADRLARGVCRRASRKS